MHGPSDNDELVEFAFVSQVVDGLPAAVLARVARQSWSFNTRMNLTGEMRLHGSRLVQVVEGRCSIVQPLAARILADPRHGSIRITAFRPINSRRHAAWTMIGFEINGPDLPADCAAPANLHLISARGGPKPVLGSPLSVVAATN